MTPPKFDSTVSLGHVLQIVIILLGIWGGVDRIERQLSAIETQLKPIAAWWNEAAATAIRAR